LSSFGWSTMSVSIKGCHSRVSHPTSSPPDSGSCSTGTCVQHVSAPNTRAVRGRSILHMRPLNQLVPTQPGSCGDASANGWPVVSWSGRSVCHMPLPPTMHIQRSPVTFARLPACCVVIRDCARSSTEEEEAICIAQMATLGADPPGPKSPQGSHPALALSPHSLSSPHSAKRKPRSARH
jgi:hypothetical protein